MAVTSYVHGHDAATLQSHQSRSAQKQAHYMLHLIKPDSTILDVGCGPGTITCDFASLAPQGNVVGVDYTEDVLGAARAEAANRNIKNIDFQIADAQKLPFADNTFDIVHCHAVLVHVLNAEKVLSEMRRVCKPGGHVTAREPDWETCVMQPYDSRLYRWKEIRISMTKAQGAEPNAGRHLSAWAAAVGFASQNVLITSNVLQYASKDERKWWGNLWADRVRRDFATRAVEAGVISVEEIDGISEAYTQWGQSETGIWALMHMMLVCQK